MRHLLLTLLLIAGPGMAQTYPAYTSTTVNDFANLLPAPLENRLAEDLDALARDTGVEMTVVTLPTRAGYANDATMESFATGLFDHWGVGDARRNDGVMLLALSEDRELRIELGAAYARYWDREAEAIVGDTLEPWLREDEFAVGIEFGTREIIARIVEPYLAGAEPSAGSSGSLDDWLVVATVGAVALFVMFSWKISDFMTTFRKCSNCGQQGLGQTMRVLRPASANLSGRGERRIECAACGHVEIIPYMIARLGSRSGSGFGGGRSGGGGASGRF